jgi:hypothetical protein
MIVPAQTIIVKYSCAACGLHRIPCEVPVRREEDVVEWTEKIMAVALAMDHGIRSPHCRPKAFTEVMIPITGTDKVGGAVVN